MITFRVSGILYAFIISKITIYFLGLTVKALFKYKTSFSAYALDYYVSFTYC